LGQPAYEGQQIVWNKAGFCKLKPQQANRARLTNPVSHATSEISSIEILLSVRRLVNYRPGCLDSVGFSYFSYFHLKFSPFFRT
jgi:hypothetical protein